MNPNKKNIEIIKQFNLSPHPEGGWFREIVRSENSLIREDGQSRNFITGIYYLLERDAKSAWHRVKNCLLYTSPSPRDLSTSRMPSSA